MTPNAPNIFDLQNNLLQLTLQDARIAHAIESWGSPAPRQQPKSAHTLLNTIIGQQVSVAAARSVWQRLQNNFGETPDFQRLYESSDEELRACGLSRQKQSYVRSLCQHVLNGTIIWDHLPQNDEEAIRTLTQIKGIGRWSAEIYLLFAEQRPNIFPAGDLGVQAGLQILLELQARPSEKEARGLSEQWHPFRSAITLLCWHIYNAA